MALGDPYVAVNDLKVYLKIPSGNNSLDSIAESAVQSASDEVEKYCNRQFNKSTDTTPRRFKPLNSSVVYTADFWSTEGLVVAVDLRGDRTFSTVIPASDYELHPLDGVVDGQTGWPFWRIELIGGSSWFPKEFASVKVTAKWGWENVPDSVKQAAILLANETFAMKSAPLGVAGVDNWGTIRVRDNGMVEKKLKRFRRDPVMVG